MNYEIKLNGLAKLYYPVVWLWEVMFSTITPRFVEAIMGIATSEIPFVLKFIIVMIVGLLLLVIYLAILGVFMGVIISLALVISVIYFLAAIINVIGNWWDFWFVNLHYTSILT